MFLEKTVIWMNKWFFHRITGRYIVDKGLLRSEWPGFATLGRTKRHCGSFAALGVTVKQSHGGAVPNREQFLGGETPSLRSEWQWSSPTVKQSHGKQSQGKQSLLRDYFSSSASMRFNRALRLCLSWLFSSSTALVFCAMSSICACCSCIPCNKIALKCI